MLDEELWDEQRQKKKRLVLLGLLLILGLAAAIPLFQLPGSASPPAVAEAMTATPPPPTPELAAPIAPSPTTTAAPASPITASPSTSIGRDAQAETGATDRPTPATETGAESARASPTEQAPGARTATTTAVGVSESGQPPAPSATEALSDQFAAGPPVEEPAGTRADGAAEAAGQTDETGSTQLVEQDETQATVSSAETEPTEVEPTPITSSRFAQPAEPEPPATGLSPGLETAPPPAGLPVTGGLVVDRTAAHRALVGPAAGVMALLLAAGLAALIK
ncbi:MAG: hypothetical protein AB1801_13800 [Chloroflexota bacterium]